MPRNRSIRNGPPPPGPLPRTRERGGPPDAVLSSSAAGGLGRETAAATRTRDAAATGPHRRCRRAGHDHGVALIHAAHDLSLLVVREADLYRAHLTALPGLDLDHLIATL